MPEDFFQTDADELERIRKQLLAVHHPELPHVPENIRNGTATLRELKAWAKSGIRLRCDVSAGELAEVMNWLGPFISGVFGGREDE